MILRMPIRIMEKLIIVILVDTSAGEQIKGKIGYRSLLLWLPFSQSSEGDEQCIK